MSLLHVNYFSMALEKQCGMNVFMPDAPDAAPFHVVYQLHGLSDDYTIWLRRTGIERYAEELGLMIVMPDGGRGFYTDRRGGTARYEQHILETVAFIDRTFHTIPTPEGRGIGGLSMGGYGAMKLGLKHPELFGSIGAHSGVLDIATALAEMDASWELAAIYGDHLAEDDCFALASRPNQKPAIYFDCGEEDFLIEHNRGFHRHLDTLKIEHVYQEFPGEHTWDYWDAHVPAALAFHCEQNFRKVSA